MRHFIQPIEELLTARIDATGIRGKLKLLLILSSLCFVFNWNELFQTYWKLRAYFSNWPYEMNPWLVEKIAHPFSQLDTSSDKTDHFEKLAFRFVPFAIAHILHTNPLGLFLLQFSLGLVFPLMVWKMLHDATMSPPVAATGALLINSLYVGFSFFYDRVFFDGFAFFFLAAAMLFRTQNLVLLFLLLAAFTDERSVIAAGLVVGWQVCRADEVDFSVIKKWIWFFVYFIAAYVFLRMAIGHFTGLQTGPNSIGMRNVLANLPHMALLVWSVYEGGWLIVVLAAFRLLDSGSNPKKVLFAGCFAGLVGVFGAGLAVGDSIRSQQYAFPLLLIALAVVGKNGGAIPVRLQRAAIFLTLITPITIYLGFEPCQDKLTYNMWPMRPGYLGFFP